MTSQIIADNDNLQRRALHEVRGFIRSNYPDATVLYLEACDDEAGHGFTILDACDSNDRSVLDAVPDDYADPVADALSVLAWDGVVGEDKHGMATIRLDVYDADEPRPAVVADGEVRCPHCDVVDDFVCATTVTLYKTAEFHLKDGRITAVNLSEVCCEGTPDDVYQCHTCHGPVLLPDDVDC